MTDQPPDDTPEDVPVHEAIRRIMRDLGAIGRDGKMKQDGGYSYRKVDDIVERVQPLQIRHGVLAAPRVRRSSAEVRTNKAGNPQEYVHTEVEWIITGPRGDVYRTPEGLLPCTFSEASDSSDKAANKAATASLKLLWSELLNIPYSGSDPDDERNEMGNRRNDPWSSASDAVLVLADQLQDRIDALPPGYPDKVYERATKAGDVRVAKVRDLPPSEAWLRWWETTVVKAEAAAVKDEADAAAEGHHGQG